VKSQFLAVLIKEDELKIEETWFAKASAINCGSKIILFPTSIWLTD
jgi:hypothetical protein